MSRTQEMLAKRGTQTEKMISGTRRDTGSRTQKLLENKGISTVEETNPRIKKSTRSSSQSTMTVSPRGISDKPFITGAPTLLTGANEGRNPAMGALNQQVNRMTGRTGVETLPSLPKLRTLPMVTKTSSEEAQNAVNSISKERKALAAKQRTIQAQIQQARFQPLNYNAKALQAEYDALTPKIADLDARLEDYRKRTGATPYSLGTSVKGVVHKASTGFNRTMANVAAFAEDALLAPFELVAGQQLGELSDNAPLNQLQKYMDKRNDEATAAYQENTAKGGKAAEIGEMLGVSTLMAAPQALLAMLTAGGSTAAQGTAALTQASQAALSPGVATTVRQAVGTMAKDPKYWASFAQVVGDGYEDAMADMRSRGDTNENSIRTKAALFAIGNGLFNAAVEQGGVQELPGELQAGAPALRSWVESMVDEGKEEVVQGIIERAMQNLTYDAGNPIASVSDGRAVFNPATAGQEFLGGAAAGGILGAAQVGLGRATSAMLNRQVRQQAGYDGGDVNYQENVQTPPTQTDTARAGTLPRDIDRDVTLMPGARREPSKLNNLDNTATSTYNMNIEGGMPNGTAEGANASYDSDGSFGAGVRAGSDGTGFDPAVADRQAYVRRGDLSDAGIVLLNPESTRRIQQTSGVVVDLENRSADSTAFSSALAAARAADGQNGWAVTLKTPEELAGDKIILARNQASGLAVAPDGDIVAVFNNKKAGGPKGATKVLIPTAIANGGKKLDCYGDTLVDIYSKFGFEPVARVAFDPEFANDGWDASKGTPDIYFMVHNGDSADTVTRKMGTYKAWTKAELDALPLMDYDSAAEYRDSILRSRETGNRSAAEGSVGAAPEGFTTSGMEGKEKTSRLADSMPYNRYEEDATALTKEDYAKIFKYTSQTEKKSKYIAESALYFMQDGEKKFLKDIDEQSYKTLTDTLKDAPAWNGPMTDAAWMIREELQRRSLDGDVTETEYTDWLRTMREHETATGQGVQANAKWTEARDKGTRSELDAWDRLQKSKMPEEKKAETFKRIIAWDTGIESAKTEQDVKNIILEISKERGVLNNAVTGKESKLLTKLADKALDGLDLAELKSFAYSASAALTTDHNAKDAGQVAKSFQVMMMLSALASPGRNLTGNTSFYLIDALAMNGGALLDRAVAQATGTRSIAAEGAPLSKEARAAIKKAAQRSAAEILLDVDMGSESRYGTDSSRTFKASGNLAERTLSIWERNQAALLTLPDEIFKGAAKSTEGKTQQLINEGKIKGVDKEYAAQQAEQLAKYRTFQDDSKVSVAIQEMHDLLNMLLGVGDSGKKKKDKTVHAFGAGDVVAPFTKVAGNLVSRGAEYSPVNAAKGLVEIADVIYQAKKNGKMDAGKQAKAVSNVARGLTGTMIAGGAMLLAQAGLLRQADDEGDDDVRKLNRAEGITGTQLNLSAAQRAFSGDTTFEWKAGDKLVDLSSVEPLNLLLNLGTIMAQPDDKNLAEKAGWGSVDAFIEASATLPVMQFVGNTLRDILQYKKDTKETIGREASKTLISSVVPNLLRSAAQGTDDRARDAYSSGTVAGELADTTKMKIPGLRQTLPSSIDNFGRDKMYQGGKVSHFLNATLNPIGVNTYMKSDASQVLDNVRGGTGRTDFYPDASAPKTIEQDKQAYKLTPEERRTYQRTMGQTDYRLVNEMSDLPEYKNLSDEQKAEALSIAKKYSEQVARGKVWDDYEVPGYVNGAQSAKKDWKMTEAEYLLAYSQYKSAMDDGKYDEDKNGKLNMAETKAAIASLPKDHQQLAWLMAYPEWPEKAAERGVSTADYIKYKSATAGLKKKDEKIQALRDSGMSAEEARALYRDMTKSLKDGKDD